MNVTIDGATGGTVLHYSITNSATQIVNSAVTGKTTLENVNLTGYYSYYGLSDRAVNSYDISEITMGENANPANVSYYGVDATLQAKDKTANCYTGTTLNNFLKMHKFTELQRLLQEIIWILSIRTLHTSHR